MKKEALSLALALAMCLGLSIPSFASEPYEAISMEFNKEEKVLEESHTLYRYVGGMDMVVSQTQDSYGVCKSDTQITVSNIGNNSDNVVFVTVYPFVKRSEPTVREYLYDEDNFETAELDLNGKYLCHPHYYLCTYVPELGEYDAIGESIPTINGLYWTASYMDYAIDSLDCARAIKPGESATFKVPEFAEETIYYIEAEIISLSGNTDVKGVHWTYQIFDDKQFETLQSSTLVQPEQPVTPAQTAAANPSNDKLTADGAVQNPTVYKINDSNYFKIRDLAAILNGTSKQFSVGYDGALSSVTATTGEGYAKLDGDLTGAPAGGEKTAEISNDTIYVDGVKVEAEVYKIDGSNYFKLRDLGKALNFYVGWNAEQGVYIETDKGYTE